MLTFAEEILLLRLDGEGEFLPVSESAMECVLVGAVLMDLSFARRVDTEPGRLMVIDSAPTGNAMLDRVLGRVADLGVGGARRDTKAVVEMLSGSEAGAIREQALSSLVERGILERVDERLLWVFRSRRYPGGGRAGGARGEAADCGCVAGRCAPGPPGRCLDLSCRCVWAGGRDTIEAGDGACGAAHRAVAQDGLDWT